MPEQDFETDELVLTETTTDLKEPPLYSVLLHNDDFTTMEFVVYVLRVIFNRSEADSFEIMLKVHHEGIGVAGIYSYEVAETKVAEVTSLAQSKEYPLRCSVQEN